MKVPIGNPWTTPVEPSRTNRVNEDNGDGDAEQEAEDRLLDDGGEGAGLEEFFLDPDDAPRTKNKNKRKKGESVHVEDPDFTEDRVLANEILFLQDMGGGLLLRMRFQRAKSGEFGR
jgi:hypothetical protein